MNHRRLGVWGGSFNPPHYGHLRSALEILEYLNLDEMWFVPTGGHALKSPQDLAPAHHRLAMLERAIAQPLAGQSDRFSVCPIEIAQEGITYTVATLTTLRQRAPEQELFFCLGADLLVELPLWRHWQTLITRAHLCFLTRPGHRLDFTTTIAGQWLSRYQTNQPTGWKPLGEPQDVLVRSVTALDICSRDLRQRLKAGRSIRYLTSDSVIEYIAQEGLYG